ncbi:hypothetical protein JRQ81_012208 [Phrynocephalus forsythii]|uniref:Uncharacterized protein n=1 Tax=Phrynocephalus forsythii TaxID=171643 RepID=A0A9Q1AQ00_9SAUR|nr:hypothetical protein JRQ81_012208 [Phrynocephalus forsythii]
MSIHVVLYPVSKPSWRDGSEKINNQAEESMALLHCFSQILGKKEEEEEKIHKNKSAATFTGGGGGRPTITSLTRDKRRIKEISTEPDLIKTHFQIASFWGEMEVTLERNTGLADVAVKLEQEEKPCGLHQWESSTFPRTSSGSPLLTIKPEKEERLCKNDSREREFGFAEMRVKVEEEEEPCSLHQSEAETSPTSSSGFPDIIMKEEEEEGPSYHQTSGSPSGFSHTVIKLEGGKRPRTQEDSVESPVGEQSGFPDTTVKAEQEEKPRNVHQWESETFPGTTSGLLLVKADVTSRLEQETQISNQLILEKMKQRSRHNTGFPDVILTILEEEKSSLYQEESVNVLGTTSSGAVWPFKYPARVLLICWCHPEISQSASPSIYSEESTLSSIYSVIRFSCGKPFCHLHFISQGTISVLPGDDVFMENQKCTNSVINMDGRVATFGKGREMEIGGGNWVQSGKVRGIVTKIYAEGSVKATNGSDGE